MGFLSITTVAIVALHMAATAAAVPNVTAIPPSLSGCRDWPSYTIAAGDGTDYLELVVDQAEDTGINGLLTGSQLENRTGAAAVETAYISLLKSRKFAKPSYRCVNGQFQQGILGTPINLAKNYRAAYIIYGDGYPLQPYWHEIGGVRQPGRFLGAKNQTTWGFRYRQPVGCGDRDTYEVKLLGLPQDTEPTAQYEPEFKGFLRIRPWGKDD